MRIRTFGALLPLLLAIEAGPAVAGASVRVAGTYSSLYYNAEGGDLLGEELRIVPVPGGYQGTLQFSEGEPGYLVLVKVLAEGNSIRFSVPVPNAYADDFRGRTSPEGLRGTFTMRNGNRIEMNLKRSCGYWEHCSGHGR